MQLLLVPLDDSILFPGMTATIAAEVGEAKEVFVLPRPEGEYAHIGTIAEVVETGRLPGGINVVTLTGLRRGRAGTASPAANGELAIDVEPIDDGTPAERRDPRARARLPRRGRGDPRAARRRRPDRGVPALDLRARARSPTPPATAPTSRSRDKQRLLETVDVTERLELALELQRERLAELQVRKRIRDDVESGAQAQQREYFLRKQMDSIRKELGEDEASVAEEYRTKIEESAMPDAVREQAEPRARPARAHGRPVGRVVDDPHLPRHAARGAVGRALRREARPGARPRGARRRPRRPRRRQGPDHRVHRRARPAPRARPLRRGPGRGRDPHPDRPARHRQDLDRRVDRPRDRARVRPHVAGRRARRGRDPRPPAHLHRRPARVAWCGRSRTPGR